MKINQAWIDEQRAMCEAATLGPWGWQVFGKLDSCLYGGNNQVAMSISTEECAFMFPKDKLMRVIRPNPDERACGPTCIDHPNAIFIALSRTALPAALDEIDRLAADNRKLREAHELAQSGYGTYAHTGNENAPSGAGSE